MTRDFVGSSAAAGASQRLHWGRIVAGAFLLELVLILALVPPLQILGPEKVIPFVYPACLVLGFGVAWWILRNVSHRPLLHGALIGIVATAIYVVLCVISPDGIQGAIAEYGVFGFIVANGLRILGCVAGGYAAQNSKNANLKRLS